MFEFLFGKKTMAPAQIRVRPVVLLILDGWGTAPPSYGNAISQAKTPVMTALLAKYPNGQLQASGEAVGLPANEVGNTEVGHLTMGSGRMVPQSLKRITMAIEDGTFFENKAFRQAYEHSLKNNSAIHLMGIVGSGNVHGSLVHFYKVLEFFKRLKAQNVFLHIFTDGRDSPPNEGKEVVAKLEQYLASLKMGRIASVMGRYYAMDRDRRWERTKAAYDALVLGRGLAAASAGQAIEQSYAAGKTDEFIEPTLVVNNGVPIGLIKDGDAVVFTNFRIDRPRQLSMALVMPNFENLKGFELGYEPDEGKVEQEKVGGKTFVREKVLSNLFFVTMTEYAANLPVSAVAFPMPVIANSLPVVLSAAGMKHLHMAESEKERMVTYYFGGLSEERLPGAEVLIVGSPKISSYDKRPQMSVEKLVSEFERSVDRQEFPFIVMNLANADMVAHTGNLPATIKACEAVDRAVGRVVEKVLAYDGRLIITADHGNAEDLLTYPAGSFYFTTATGEVNTDHSNNPVPVIFVGREFETNKRTVAKGTLADIAPTVLQLLGLTVPAEMKGQNLLLQ